MEETGKAKYWEGVCYVENMREDWEEEIDDILDIPFAYCIHDKDKDKDGNLRKAHVHIFEVFKNTTTQNFAMTVLDKLSEPGKTCISTIEAVHNPKKAYDYLIHDTANARKKGKYQYPQEARKTGNGFDIGSYEQISLADKKAKVIELSAVILDKQFTNYADFYEYIIASGDSLACEVVLSYSSHLERLCKGCYQRTQTKKEKMKRDIAKQTIETNKGIWKAMEERERLASMREAQTLIALGLDPVTGEQIDGLPF